MTICKNSHKNDFPQQKLDRLVYFESTNNIEAAIAYEKKLKGWNRLRKINLIKKQNPKWIDLSENWYPKEKND